MDPNTLSVLQLKNILRQYQLPLHGRKTELIIRMQQADPSGAWIQEAVQYRSSADNPVENNQEEADVRGSDALPVFGDQLAQRETELMARENSLLQRELELLRRENELLRMSPRSSPSTASRMMLSIKNVSDLLCEYNGSDDFERWRAQVNLLKILRNTYELDENATKVLVGSKLQGRAADWYFSLVDHLSMEVDRLLEKMDTMFNQPLSRLERKRLFENRIWEKGESFNDYCHAKVILGNKVPIAEEETVEYVVDGIPSTSLRNQAKMHCFSTVSELTKAFRRISLNTMDTTTARREFPGVKNSKTKIITSTTAISKDNSRPIIKGVVKCYQCDEVGHYAKYCPAKKERPQKLSTDKKTEPGDRKMDHQVKVDESTEQLAATSSGSDSGSDGDDRPEEESDIYVVEMHEESRDEFQRITELQIQGSVPLSCVARVDTGCPVTLIKESIVSNVDMQRPGCEWNQYRGINNSKLQVKGTVTIRVTMDGESKPVTIGVVPDDTMSVPLLIGRDALKLFGYRLTKSPAFDKVVSEIFHIDNNSNNSSININPRISLHIRESLETLFTDRYIRPNRSELPKVQIEATLVLKDNKPIQFGPRRLGFSEKEKVRHILND